MKSLFGGGTALTTALVLASVLFYATPLDAEPNSSQQNQTRQQQQKQGELPAPQSAPDLAEAADAALRPEAASGERAAFAVSEEEPPAMPASTAGSKPTGAQPTAPAQSYTATAYSFTGRTASGRPVAKGLIAADTSVLPIGTRVRLDAGPYSGEYVVADTGGAVRGRRIDVWVPTTREAFRFGRRGVRLTVLSYGNRRAGGKKK
jgi:3D (Asp-Asp-Asp) domain-containing protein